MGLGPPRSRWSVVYLPPRAHGDAYVAGADGSCFGCEEEGLEVLIQAERSIRRYA